MPISASEMQSKSESSSNSLLLNLRPRPADLTPELGRRHSQLLLERPTELTLVAKTSPQGDLHQGTAGKRQLATGKLNAQPANILPHRASETPAKQARQVDRMNRHFLRHL